MLCEASCGLEVRHDGTNIHAVRGDVGDSFSGGYICPKAVALKDIHEDKDRLKLPLRRFGNDFREVSWEEALSFTAHELARIQKAHGRDAAAVYVGNPLGHSYAGTLSALLFGAVLGTKNRYSSQSVDALPRLFAVFQMYGNQALLPVPDIERTEYLLIFGANPLVSNGSIMTAPDMKNRLRRLRERGGRAVVVDPRRTETAREADEHVFIQPASDAWLLLAMLHVIFDERLERLGRLEPLVRGLDAIRSLVRRFPPERSAAITGVPAELARRLAREFAGSARAAAYGRMGTSTQRFGAVASWLVDVLNVVTGNLDRPGGVMFNTPAADLPAIAQLLGQKGSFARFTSRVQGLPEFNGELPASALAEEIETPGSGQIRALTTICGNPVLALPNGKRLEEAFSSLAFMASVDIYLNETTRHAHVILPTTFGLERDDYPLLSSAMAVRNRARYAPAVVAPSPGALHDWQVLNELALRLLGERGSPVLGAALRRTLGRLNPRHMLDLMLRLGPHGLLRRRQGLSLVALGEHGVDLGELEPRLPGVLATADQRICLAPDVLVQDVSRLESELTGSAGLVPALRLVGRRQLRSNNSWMHNASRLMGGRERCTLLVHPSDAARLGLQAGGQARITSRVGSITAPVEVSDDVMPGVVSLPHGWGHDRAGTRLGIAEQKPGVSLNDVTDDRLFDPLSGVAHLNGVPVEIAPIRAGST